MKKKNKMTAWIIGIIGFIILLIILTPAKWLLVELLFSADRYATTSSRQSERKNLNKQTRAITIEWVDALDEDFSFSEKWIYSENSMRDLAKIEKSETPDSLLSDEELCAKWEQRESEKRDDYLFSEKTHYPYTLQVDSQLSHIAAEYIKKNKIECQSGAIIFQDLGFCFLNLLITDKVCYPVIAIDDIQINKPQFLGDYSSATPAPFKSVNYCVRGWIKIDKTWWDKAQIKASFAFAFVNPKFNNRYVLTGKIYTPIKWMDIESPVITDKKQYEYMISLSNKYR